MPVRGTGEISQLGLSVVVFTALAYCGIRGSHVAVDILVSRLRKRAQQVLRIFMQFLSVAILGILAWQLFSYTAKMRDVGQSSVMLGIPVYPFVFVSAIGTALLALVYLVQLFITIAEVNRR
jgi:TRAP-type C4-dicarboxylate transport system permease small subunit